MSLLDMTKLRRQLALLKERQSALHAESDNDLFPVWLLLALASSNEQAVAASVTGGSNDNDIDAVYVDENAVWIVQGKLHRTVGEATESAKSVRSFAGLVDHLYEGPETPSDPDFWRRLGRNSRDALGKFTAASKAARERDLAVHLIFASNGKFSKGLEESLGARVARVSRRASLSLLDHREIGQTLTNYIRDVAPAVPSLRLAVESGDLRPQSIGESRLKSWTIATRAEQVAALQSEGGEQLFARNIRHGLGDKVHVNAEIRKTLLDQPDRFWFLNNGLTIACQSARIDDDAVLMRGAQIINGQQTTRTIFATLKERGVSRGSRDARVAVRIISFESVPEAEADDLIAQVVEATNFQNAISKADLRSNDPRQIEMARALGSRGYLYVRKKGKQDTPSGLNFLKRKVKREVLFSAAAGALHDSVALRKGRTPLFDPIEGYYDEVLSKSTDFLLAAWHHWMLVNRLSRNSAVSKAAKYAVHYAAFRELESAFRRQLGTIVRRLEVGDKDVKSSLEDLIEAHLKAATTSYRKHRRVDGEVLQPKPYFQREVSSANLRVDLKSRKNARLRESIDSAISNLRDQLETV